MVGVYSPVTKGKYNIAVKEEITYPNNIINLTGNDLLGFLVVNNSANNASRITTAKMAIALIGSISLSQYTHEDAIKEMIIASDLGSFTSLANSYEAININTPKSSSKLMGEYNVAPINSAIYTAPDIARVTVSDIL